MTTRTRRTGFNAPPRSPSAPNWLKPLAAAMLTHGEDRAAARFLWQQIAQSEEPWLRRNAERSLLQLQALDVIDQLNAVIARYPPAPGEPHSWADLIRRRVLRGVPYDPNGYALRHRSRDRTVSASRTARRSFRCRRSRRRLQ